MLLGVGKQQLVALGLQLGEARAELAGAGLDHGHFAFAGQLRPQRAFLRTQVDQLHAPCLNRPAQLADARIDVGIDAGARVRIAVAEAFQLALGAGELLVVLLDLGIDEAVGLAAFAFLGRQAFLDHQFGEAFGNAIRALGVRVAVGDLDEVGAGIGDLGPADDLLDQLVLLERRRVVVQPAAGLQDFLHHLLAEGHFAQDAGAVDHIGGDGTAFHQRSDDVAFLHQDGGRGGVALRQQHAQPQRKHGDGGEDAQQRNRAAAEFLGEDRQQGERATAPSSSLRIAHRMRSGMVITSPGATLKLVDRSPRLRMRSSSTE